jgi:DNA polymerase-3 subunit delta'
MAASSDKNAYGKYQSVIISALSQEKAAERARELAAGILCTGDGKRPCGKCASCGKIARNTHPDLILVSRLPDSKGNLKRDITVDQIREVCADAYILPNEADRKVYIINEAEKMNVQAQNALLKTLEEPPEYAVIIILTTNVDALLPTILSRCVVLNMKPVDDEKVKEFLMEYVQVPDYKAEVCAAFARGNLGKAKILASSEEFDKIKTEAIALLKHIDEMNVNEISIAIKQMNEYKLEINDYLDILAIWYRDALMFKATADANNLIFRDEIKFIKQTASRSTYEGLEIILKALDKAKARLSANVSFDLTMELLLLTIKENSNL